MDDMSRMFVPDEGGRMRLDLVSTDEVARNIAKDALKKANDAKELVESESGKADDALRMASTASNTAISALNSAVAANSLSQVALGRTLIKPLLYIDGKELIIAFKREEHGDRIISLERMVSTKHRDRASNFRKKKKGWIVPKVGGIGGVPFTVDISDYQTPEWLMNEIPQEQYEVFVVRLQAESNNGEVLMSKEDTIADAYWDYEEGTKDGDNKHYVNLHKTLGLALYQDGVRVSEYAKFTITKGKHEFGLRLL